MWIYQQSTGVLRYRGLLVATGYAGAGADKNQPADQALIGHGPLPRGEYRIGDAFTSPTLGPLAMKLEPFAGTEMFGRSGFYMHADSLQHPGDASEGCIVMPYAGRVAVAIHPDRLLEVVE